MINIIPTFSVIITTKYVVMTTFHIESCFKHQDTVVNKSIVLHFKISRRVVTLGCQFNLKTIKIYD